MTDVPFQGLLVPLPVLIVSLLLLHRVVRQGVAAGLRDDARRYGTHDVAVPPAGVRS